MKSRMIPTSEPAPELGFLPRLSERTGMAVARSAAAACDVRKARSGSARSTDFTGEHFDQRRVRGRVGSVAGSSVRTFLIPVEHEVDGARRAVELRSPRETVPSDLDGSSLATPAARTTA